MSTLALLPLLIPAGILALVLLWPRVRSGPPAPRLVVEVLLVTGGLAALLWGLMTAAQRLPW
jgi:hypothetical protein